MGGELTEMDDGSRQLWVVQLRVEAQGRKRTAQNHGCTHHATAHHEHMP